MGQCEWYLGLNALEFVPGWDWGDSARVVRVSSAGVGGEGWVGCVTGLEVRRMVWVWVWDLEEGWVAVFGSGGVGVPTGSLEDGVVFLEGWWVRFRRMVLCMCVV